MALALLTSISIPPNVFTASCTALVTAPSSRISTAQGRHFPPTSSTIYMHKNSKESLQHCSIHWCQRATLGLLNRQIWLPPSENYITCVLELSIHLWSGKHGTQGLLLRKQIHLLTNAGIARRFISKEILKNTGLLVGRGKKSQISRDFQGQICGKNGRFRGNFRGQFHWKTIGKEQPISWELPEQISLEGNWFCADLRKVFKETRRSYSIYSGFIPQYEIVLYK